MLLFNAQLAPFIEVSLHVINVTPWTNSTNDQTVLNAHKLTERERYIKIIACGQFAISPPRQLCTGLTNNSNQCDGCSNVI